MRIKMSAVAVVLVAAACKTPDPSSSSDVLSAPRANNQEVEQGGKVIGNKCDAGGHEGPTTGKGWPFSEKEGCFLECRDLNALKADYLEQLKMHRVYGDIAKITAQDPDAGRIADFFAKKIAAKGAKMHRLDSLTPEQLHDAKDWPKLGIKPGDIFINMNFGQPNHAGIFYSKRGMAHARLVVKVTKSAIHTFDGGWNQFSVLREPNSQTVWLRPRAEFLGKNDLKNAVKWAELMEPLDYDNNLIDDWAEFRKLLHANLDSGMSNFRAREQAFKDAQSKKIRPSGFKDTFSFKPPSGLYCSEGTAGIFSYLGFRQYGETAIDIATSFSDDGSLPNWKLYEDALSGFGADSDKNTYMMHKLFYDYFTVFEAGRKAGVIKVPGLADSQNTTFAIAAEANLKAVEADSFGTGNHIDKQLEDFENALGATQQSQMQQQVAALRAGLQQVATQMGGANPMNVTQAVWTVFYANQSYGPHTFFENSKYFDLKGVFYNTNMKGNQALFVSDWWLETFGQPRRTANIQTTLYRIKNDPSLPADHCVVGPKAPLIQTN